MPPVTLALIAANIAVYLLQVAVPGIEGPFALWPLGSARVGGTDVGFEPWQLVTYAFLHGSWVHIFFNMFALYMFGGPIEQVFGTRRFIVYYFVCVVSAAVAQLTVSALTGAVYPAIGASGGVFGLLLAYAIYFPRNRIMLLFPPIPMPARVFVIVYAVLELFFGVTGTEEGVAHFAHLGGLVGGFVLLRLWRGHDALRRRL
jgi:membrane associated rhomboid family serine protease